MGKCCSKQNNMRLNRVSNTAAKINSKEYQGKVIDNFLLKKQIRFGGFGTVYYAKDLITNENVCVKVFRPYNEQKYSSWT